jgi:hypothetical protein
LELKEPLLLEKHSEIRWFSPAEIAKFDFDGAEYVPDFGRNVRLAHEVWSKSL